MERTYMLNIKDIDVYYNNIQVLYKVSLTVKKGEIVVVLGANGAGKTTLLKAISGICATRSGTIEFMDKRIDNAHPHFIVKSGISHCSEGKKIFPKMTVFKNLMLGAYIRNDKIGIHKDMEKLFDLFPILREKKGHTAGSLSGGEQQMLVIARALMSKPHLLILDEPSMGIAPILINKIKNYIKWINKQGVSILLVEQNAHMALQLGNRGYVLENGKIALGGTCEELFDKKEVRKAYLGI